MVIKLVRWQVGEQASQAFNTDPDFGALRRIDASGLIGVVLKGEIQAGQEFEPDGARVVTSIVQPFFEATYSGGGDVQDLPRGQFILLDQLAGNIAARFQPLENGIGLALAEMPDVAKFGLEFLVQIVTMTWLSDEEAQQGKFGGYIAHDILIE